VADGDQVDGAERPDEMADGNQNDARSRSGDWWHQTSRVRARPPRTGGAHGAVRHEAGARTAATPDVRADDDPAVAAMGLAAHGSPPQAIWSVTGSRQPEAGSIMWSHE